MCKKYPRKWKLFSSLFVFLGQIQTYRLAQKGRPRSGWDCTYMHTCTCTLNSQKMDRSNYNNWRGWNHRPHEGLFPTLDIGSFCKVTRTFRQKLSRHSKFSPTLDTDLFLFYCGFIENIKQHSTFEFSSRHSTLATFWGWHPTFRPPFMGPNHGTA